jgi:cellulose synthase operon protein YhjQ
MQKAQQAERDAAASKAVVVRAEKPKTTLITEAAIASAMTTDVIAESVAKPVQPISSPLLRPRSDSVSQDGTQAGEVPSTVYGKSIGKVISSSVAWALEQNAKCAAQTQTAPVEAVPVVAQADAAAPVEASRAEAETNAVAPFKWLGLERIEAALQEQYIQAPARVEITRDEDWRIPVLAVFSVAGGVGKTNLVATLGRALSAQGEAVLLADTTSRGLLSIYFGEQGIGSDEVRKVKAESGAALGLAVYGTVASSADEQALANAILRDARRSQHVLVDVTTGASWVIRRLANQRLKVLVPMACDMNSVNGLQEVERIFQGIVDSNGQELRPFYVLSQFDESQALHRGVRDVLGRQLGDRLLQRTIQRSAAISEALAAEMTVVDYAPNAVVSREFAELASWLRGVSPTTAELVATGRRA